MADMIQAKQNKMKRLESRKSHSWWWDSHVSPKNKWLQENLEVMDGYVKRMLKLIEEDADSFAKRAEMYYKKRPELINLVEEFYRMYRALSERYDVIAGELRKRVPSDIQSQSSGISDTSSDLASTLDQNIERQGSGPRAAGFDIFLGGGGNKSDHSNKAGDDQSLGSDSESESDDYDAMPSSDEEQEVLRRRITELEAEIKEVKEKSRLLEEENSKALLSKFAEYEKQLNESREKIRMSEDELNKLKNEVQKYKSLEYSDHLEMDKEKVNDLQESNGGLDVKEDKENEFRMLETELKITKEKLLDSETKVENLIQELQRSELSINHLQDQLGSVQNDVSELQDLVLKYESSLSDHDQETKKLMLEISVANKTYREENSRLQIDIDGLLKERIFMEDNVKKNDLRCQSLQDNVSKLESEKQETKTLLGAEIEKLNSSINGKNSYIDALTLSYETLLIEKNAADDKITVYISEIESKNIQINEMNKHLHQLHLDHVELIVAAEGARKHGQELKTKVMELEKEIETQREVIQQGAEEKREAIRQLCLSLEYYRNGYHRFRQAVIEHKRLPVMAS